jgi:ATP-binding cassette subfamily B protein
MPAADFFTPHAGADIGQLARLGRFVWPYRRQIAGALTALVVAAGCVLALGQGLRHVIDGGFASGDPRLLNGALAAVVGLPVCWRLPPTRASIS